MGEYLCEYINGTNLSTTTKFEISTTVPPVEVGNHQVRLSSSDIVVVVIYIVIFFFGMIGNLFVIRYFGFKTKHKRLYNIYLIHLAISDLVSSTVTPIYSVYGVVYGNIWHFGQTSCTVISLTGPLTINVSAWLLASIAHERYRGIGSPFKPRLTKLRIHLTVIVIWVVSLIILVPYIYSIHLIEGKYCAPKWSHPLYELGYAVGTLVLQSILPIAYMTFTVNRILYALRNRMKEDGIRIGNNSKYSSRYSETSFISKRQQENTSSMRSNSMKERPSSSVHDRSINSPVKNKSIVNNNTYVRKKSTPLSTEMARNLFESKLKQDNNKIDKEMTVNDKTNITTESVSPKIFDQKLLKNQESMVFPSVHVTAAESSSPISTRLYNFFMRSNTPSPTKHYLSPCQSSRKSFNIPSKSDLQDQPLFTPTTNSRHQPRSVSLDLTSVSDYSNKITIHSKSRSENSSIKKTSIYRRVRTMFSFDQKGSKLKQRQRISMLVVTFSVFVVCSLPYNIFYVIAIIIYDLLKDNSLLDTLSKTNLWVSTLVVANSIMNCFIYAGMDRGFKSYCLRFCHFNKKKDQSKMKPFR